SDGRSEGEEEIEEHILLVDREIVGITRRHASQAAENAADLLSTFFDVCRTPRLDRNDIVLSRLDILMKRSDRESDLIVLIPSAKKISLFFKDTNDFVCASIHTNLPSQRRLSWKE